MIKNKINNQVEPDFCVRCGYCKERCPTYLTERNEIFSPRGRISLLKRKDVKSFFDIDTCVKCMECEISCPIGIVPWRDFLNYKSNVLWGKPEKIISKIISKNKTFFKLFLFFKARNAVRKERVKIGKIKEVDEEIRKIAGNIKGEEVFLFPTCFGFTYLKNVFENVVSFLEILGYKVLYPKKFLCCGAPVFFSGALFVENPLKENPLKDKNLKNKKILVMGTTCTYIMKEFLDVEEVSDFIIRKFGDKFKSYNHNKEFIVHKSCHEKHGIGENREKFFKTLGFDFIDFPCCGFGGSNFIKYKNSKKIGEEMLKSVGNKRIISSSPGCIIHIQNIKKSVVLHTVEFLYEMMKSRIF